MESVHSVGGAVSAATWRRHVSDDYRDGLCTMSELLLDSPEARIRVGRDGHEYFALAQFRYDRGERELARDNLLNVLKCVVACVDEGLPMGPLHVPDRAHAWTEHTYDRSLRATTPTGEVRIRPLVDPATGKERAYALLHVPDRGFRLLQVASDPETLKAEAYRLAARTDFPRAAVRVADLRHEFQVSSREGELAHVTVGDVAFTLVPTFDEQGKPRVAVELAAQRPTPGSPVHILAVHELRVLQHLEVLWTDAALPPGNSPAQSLWQRANAAARAHARPTAAAPPGVDRDGSPVPAAAPAGMDPLVWEGFVLQLHDVAARTHNRDGRRLYAIDMRTTALPLLLELARRGRNIRGRGRDLRTLLEREAGCRLRGSHTTFKQFIAIFADHSDFCRTLAHHVREFPFAELYRRDSTIAMRLRAYATARRSSPPAESDARPPSTREDLSTPSTPRPTPHPVATNEQASASVSPEPAHKIETTKEESGAPASTEGAPATSAPPAVASPPPSPPPASPRPASPDVAGPTARAACADAPTPSSARGSPLSFTGFRQPSPVRLGNATPRQSPPGDDVRLRERNLSINPRFVADTREDLAADKWFADLGKAPSPARGPPDGADGDD